MAQFAVAVLGKASEALRTIEEAAFNWYKIELCVQTICWLILMEWRCSVEQ